MKQNLFFIIFEGLSFGEKKNKRTQALNTLVFLIEINKKIIDTALKGTLMQI